MSLLFKDLPCQLLDLFFGGWEGQDEGACVGHMLPESGVWGEESGGLLGGRGEGWLLCLHTRFHLSIATPLLPKGIK